MRSKKEMLRRAGMLLSFLLLTAMGCAQPLTTRERGTLVGGGLGAATGAVIGAVAGAPAAGAAIGGALGAVAGAVTSDQLMAQDRLLEAQERDIATLRAEIRRQQAQINRLD